MQINSDLWKVPYTVHVCDDKITENDRCVIKIIGIHWTGPIAGSIPLFATYYFYAPGSNDWGHIVFVLSVCLSVVNFNLRYNFWTVRDRDFIFGMHIPLMKLNDALSNGTKVNDLDFDLEAKNSFDFVAAGSYWSVSQTPLDFSSSNVH